MLFELEEKQEAGRSRRRVYRPRIVGVFGRQPQAGRVKTRLAQSIGEDAACSLYTAMLRDSLRLAKAAAKRCDGEVVLVYTPRGAFANSPTSLRALWRGRRSLQHGADLGARMQYALTQLQRGGPHVLLIGSDAPDLPPQFLEHAWRLLEQHASPVAGKLVIGPSEDGGFYLIGTSGALPAELFDGVAWSSQSTLEQVIERAQLLGVATDATSLPVWRDVDEISDLTALSDRLQIQESSSHPPAQETAPHTRLWLRTQSTLAGVHRSLTRG